MKTKSVSRRPSKRQSQSPRTDNHHSNGSGNKKPQRLETRRAYTLGLHGQPNAMRALAQTHKVMNLGAEVFCDWLLTLGGGLPLTRPDEAVLTALAWLTVETNPPEHAPLLDTQDVAARLDQLFAERLSTEDTLTVDAYSSCHRALAANVREGAVRVDRARVFDELCETLQLPDKQLAREDAHTVWESLFQVATLTLNLDGEGETVRAAAKGAGQRTSHLFSHLFGESEAYGKQKSAPTAAAEGLPPDSAAPAPIKRYRLHYRDAWGRYLSSLLLGTTGMKPGRDSEEPSSTKDRAYSAGPHLREMFFAAAERIAAYRSFMRGQEASRLGLISADQVYRTLEQSPDTAEACALLDTMRNERSAETLSADLYLPGKRSVRGWANLVTAWQDSADEVARRETVSRFIGRTNRREVGDPALFLKLAEDRFIPVWQTPDGSLRPELLLRCIDGWQLRADITRLKIIAFCHIDPYVHPIRTRFGVSRPSMKLSILREHSETLMHVELALWDGKHIRRFPFKAASERIKRELLPEDHEVSKDQPSRRTLLAERARECSIHESGKEATEEVGELKALDLIFAEQAGASLILTTPQSAEPSPHQEQFQRWQLVLSVRLMPRGPWLPLARRLEGTIESDKSAGQLRVAPLNTIGGRFRGLAFPFTRSDLKTGFGGELSGIPGLRLLGVDLRQAYGAAVALWETLSEREYQACIKSARNGGQSVDVHDIFTTIAGGGLLRRIGPPGSAAPWARLVYQKLLKLPGERRGDIRTVNRDELIELHALAILLELPDFQSGLLVSHALKLACEGVRRFMAQQARLAVLIAKLTTGHAPATWLAQAGRLGLGTQDNEHPEPPVAADRLKVLWDDRDRKAQNALRLLAILIEGRRAALRTPNKGGLSLAAIELREVLYRTQKAFACRPTPDTPKGTLPADILAARLRSKTLRMKRERARVLASAIVRAALGFDKQGKVKYPFAHAVIIEDLSDIGPRAANTRDMNERLIRWAAAAVRDRLAESCQLHGLHLRMEEAAYTSRQDPQTGGPGLRCVEISEHTFLENWKHEYERSAARLNTRQETARDRVICALWKSISDRGPLSSHSVLIPAAEGRLLVLLDANGQPIKRHVALNAAANIGLSALLDPRLPSARWRIPAVWNDSKGLYEAAKDRDRSEGALLSDWQVGATLRQPSALEGAAREAGTRRRSRTGPIVNLWRDPSNTPLNEGEWLSTPEYWNLHEARIAEVLATATH